jgi:hypothetical protein
MDLHSIGRVILLIGVALALLGGMLMLLGQFPFLRQIGSLPGDIRIEGQGFTCLIPIVSTILLSILATIILNLIIRLINRP